MEKRDYSLLRPFDLEAAKAGVLLTCPPSSNGSHLFEGAPIWKYVAGPDVDGRILVELIETGRFAELAEPESFRMAPLAWVEGLPAYKGDVLYSKHFATCAPPLPDGGKFTVTGFRDSGVGGGCLAAGEASRFHFTLPSSCSWTKPAQMVKRQGWVNVYRYSGSRVDEKRPQACLSEAYKTRELADKQAFSDRIACVPIEWEEEVSE